MYVPLASLSLLATTNSALQSSGSQTKLNNPADPVPYLDILGVAEGAILLICASLPALGPLFRHARESLSSKGDSKNIQPSAKSHERAGHAAHASWGTLKGHKLEDPVRASTIQQGSSDDILLVEVQTKQGF